MTQALTRVLNNSITMDEALDRMSLEKGTIKDFTAPLSQWEPTVNGGTFGLRNLNDNRVYRPTETAMTHMARLGNMSAWAIQALTTPVINNQKKDKDGEPVVIYHRDARDAEVLRDYVKVHLFQKDRIDMDKPRLFRTWEDGTLRAVLSKDYARVNNQWMVQVARAYMPDNARVIRYRGNADTMYMDVFYPDTVQHTNDGGLGGMVHLGNSEIGERRVIVAPAILRMICTNGAIGWASTGEEIKLVHRRKDGLIDLTELESKVRDHVESVIPTFGDGIAAILELQNLGVGETPIPNLFAQLAIDNHIGKKEIKGVWNAWATEIGIIGADEGKTAFGLQAAITRFGQSLDASSQYDFDHIGGKMMGMDRKAWDSFLARATNLNQDKVEKMVGELN